MRNKLLFVLLSLLSLRVFVSAAHITTESAETSVYTNTLPVLKSKAVLSVNTGDESDLGVAVHTDTDYRDGLETIAGDLWMLTHLEGQPVNLDTVTVYTSELPHFRIDPVSKAISGYDGNNSIQGDLSADTFGSYLTGNAQKVVPDQSLTSETGEFSWHYLGLLATAKQFSYKDNQLLLKATSNKPPIATFQRLPRESLPIKGVQWFLLSVNSQLVMLTSTFFPEIPRLFIDSVTNKVTGHSGCNAFEGFIDSTENAVNGGTTYVVRSLSLDPPENCGENRFRLFRHNGRLVTRTSQELANTYIDFLIGTKHVERDADTLRLSAHSNAEMSMQFVTAYNRLRNIMDVRWELIHLSGWDLTIYSLNRPHYPFIFIDPSSGRLSGNMGCNYIQGYISEHESSHPVIRDLFAFQTECDDIVAEQAFYRILKEATHVERFHDQLIFRATRYGPATAVFQASQKKFTHQP